jgi:hypothetical protein
VSDSQTDPPIDIYRERAHLVAHLARTHEAHWSVDPDEPDWPVICVHTPAGQLAWHIAASDLDLFPPGLPTRPSDWDGHSTAEKYTRLGELDTIPPAAASAGDLLTADEHRAIDLLGRAYTLLGRIVADGPTREADLAEHAAAIHVVQQAVMAQAAARAYPALYRPLGGVLRPATS